MPGFSILNDLLRGFVSAVPKLLGALFIFAVGYYLSKVIYKILLKVLSKSGIDKLSDQLNEIEIVQKANLKIQPSKILAGFIYYFLLLIFVVAATDVLSMPAISQLMSNLINYIPNVLAALLVLTGGVLLAETLRKTTLTTCKSLGLPSANTIATFVFWFIFIAAIISALAQAGIDTAFVATNLSIIIGGAVAAFALGYGLASRDIVANYLSSFYSQNKIQIGDHLRIGEVKGQVMDIDSTSLTLQTKTSIIVVPLSRLQTDTVEIFHPDEFPSED